MMAHAQQAAARRLEVGAAGGQWSSRVWRALFACAMCWLVLLASACTGGPHPEPPFSDPNASGQAGTGFDNGPVGTGGVGGGGGAGGLGGAGGSGGTEVTPPLQDGGENVDDDDAGIVDDDAGALH